MTKPTTDSQQPDPIPAKNAPPTERRRLTTEDRAIDVIEGLLACLPAVEHRSERELAVAEKAAHAIERLRVLREDRRYCGGWAELKHG